MSKWRVTILAVFISLLLIIAVGSYLVLYNIQQYVQQPLIVNEDRELWVESGASLNGTLLKLERQGVITQLWKLKAFVKMNPQFNKIRAGVYQISVTDTPLRLLDKLTKGEVKQYSITLLEGHTIKQWKQALVRAPKLKVADDIFEQVLSANGDNSGLPEGKFFPDTYHYTASTTVRTLLDQSYKKMSKQLDSAWQNRQVGLPLNNAYELLVLASIIEKETAVASERGLVSAVFINRLRKRMRLQTDPTVIYGMGDKYNGNITRKDLRTKTAFNTYRIKGLPPTPIAAPSLASLKAAANPADVPYLFFVAKDDGSHQFSITLKQHNRAVNRYQRNQK
ncbi:MAG: endolytic transglycosylase MltG [Parashewanella sp.]